MTYFNDDCLVDGLELKEEWTLPKLETIMNELFPGHQKCEPPQASQKTEIFLRTIEWLKNKQIKNFTQQLKEFKY